MTALVSRRLGASGLVLALVTWAAAEPVPLGPCGPIDRMYDPVEIHVQTLRRLGGTAPASLGLLAFRATRPEPIPFQLDEAKGRRPALPDGSEPTRDDKPGVLDADDQLVFMACDAGEQRSAEEVELALANAGRVSAWREITVRDPLTTRAGFVYLVASERPPRTERRYVTYLPGGDLVTTGRYRVGLVDALPTYLALAFQGPLGPNLLDGFRLRAEARLRANLAHWTFNEHQGRHELDAWRAGPVRLVRRSRHQANLGLGIHLTAGTAHTYFYPQHVFAPGALRLPFPPRFLFSEITAFGGADGRDLRGWRYHAPGVPDEGFAVDGRMDEAEQGFAGRGDWFVLAREREALLFVMHVSQNLAEAVPIGLVYRDDAARPNPPEVIPGTVPLVGYEGRGVEKLPRGRYKFQVRIFGLAGYQRGDEQHVLRQLDTPLTTEVTAEGPPAEPVAVPPSDGR